MAGLLDELKGILSPEEYAKLAGNATLTTRMTRGDELRSFYDGDETVTPPPPVNANNTPDPQRTTPPPNLDLTGIERMLDSKLSKLDERIDNRLNSVIEQRAGELVDAAVKRSITINDGLNRVYLRHAEEFPGEKFDSKAFNDYVEMPENKGRFRSVEEAWESMTADKRMQRRIDAAKAEGKAEGIAAGSSRTVPGTTPGPAMSSNVRVIMSRGRTDANGQPNSRVDRAAATLDKIMARNQEAAS